MQKKVPKSILFVNIPVEGGDMGISVMPSAPSFVFISMADPEMNTNFSSNINPFSVADSTNITTFELRLGENKDFGIFTVIGINFLSVACPALSDTGENVASSAFVSNRMNLWMDGKLDFSY